MKKYFGPLCLILILTACAAGKSQSNTTRSSGHNRATEVAYLDDNSYLLVASTNNETYGYKPENPVMVGGAQEQSGPLNERRFLNGLLGPEGQPLEYFRKGSCCAFKSPNGFNGTGLLDHFRIYWKGSTDTLSIYINMYDKGDLKIPVGLTARSGL